MHIIKNMKNFLLDQDYYIDIFGEYIHVYRYLDLKHLSENKIELGMNHFNLEITGKNLLVVGMDHEEILIKGVIEQVRFFA